MRFLAVCGRRLGASLPCLGLVVVLLSVPSARSAETVLETVRHAVGSDLESALTGLAEARREVEAERLPLARSLAELEQTVADRRRELDRAERSNENALVELNAQRALAKGRAEELKFVEALMGEYLRVFETRIHIAEAEHYAKELNGAKEASAQPGDLGAKLEAEAGVVQLGLQRIAEVTGGSRFQGKALAPSGRLEAGTFLVAGPVAYFSADGAEVAGLAELQLGAPGPTVIALEPTEVARIRSWFRAGEAASGDLPVDLTTGGAVKLGRTRDTLVEHILKGGPVMGPILLLAFVALGIFVMKWLEISRVRTLTPSGLQVILTALNSGDRTSATERARGVKGPVGAMLVRAIQHVDEPKETIEEVMYEEMLQTKPQLEKWLPFLALSAAAAPLLGLLGTVTGMINTFNMITAFGTGDPKTLAGGISEALITTEYGLIVAIPSLLLHSVLSRRVKGVLGSMEQTTVGLINGLETNLAKEIPRHVEPSR